MKMKLMREVRFHLRPPEGPIANAWAGWPNASAAAPFISLQVTVSGLVDPQTGYLCNIQQLDRVVREKAIPHAVEMFDGPDIPCGEALLLRCRDAIRGGVPEAVRLEGVRLHLSPFVSFETCHGDERMVSVSAAFEFSAAHRLYSPHLSDQRNREVFGKCANPNGHGHNYQLEITVRGTPPPDTGVVIGLAQLEAIVKQRVIDRFDHKHLNLDCAEFKDLNPSVENIATVIWNLLDGCFDPARLARVRVWETPKTCAEIEGGL